jgi:hypothetical protein
MKIHYALAGLALAAAGALAQTPPPAPSPEVLAARVAVGKSCEVDMKAHCSGKEGHEGMMCLGAMPQEHVSAGCKDAMGKLVKLMAPPK